MTKIGLWVTSLALLFLCGCSPMLYDQYVVVSPHEMSEAVDNQDYVVVQNYLSLKNALLDMVEYGTTSGKIRVYDYVGDLDEDFQNATEEVLHNDPLGTYALETLEYDLAFVVSYYEGTITMTYRRSQEQIANIERLDPHDLTQRVSLALGDLETEVVVRDTFFTTFDVNAVVESYYQTYPALCVEKPTVTMTTYPSQGYVRTVELLFSYENPVADLADYRSSIETSVRAAQEYVRYREEQQEKLRLLYTFFNQRFVYNFEETNTPVYSFLCKGIADSHGVAKSLELICQAMDMECYTVTGTKLGVAYSWNIILVDDAYYHVDLMDALVREVDDLPMMTDQDLVDYHWDVTAVPACSQPIVVPEQPPLAEQAPVSPPPSPDEPEVALDIPVADAEVPEPEAPTIPEEPEIFSENGLTNDESVVQ